jgi:hypothetical protein
MKLNQPAESDSEAIRLGHASKNESTKKHSKDNGKFMLGEAGTNSKSLRSDWEETLSKKEKHREPSRVVSEREFRLDNTPEEEIHLHVDADEIHEGPQLETKADPLWEPWQAKKPEKPVPPATIAAIEAQPVVEQEPEPPVSLDPSLASEALLHSQAVATIAREHAQQATAPSYKDQLPKEAQEIMERLQPAKDHHFEQSAWHNIEVDNKTGRAVEKPTFSYGEAFRDEQRTEANAFHTDGAVTSASGQLAVGSPIFDNLNNKDAAILTNAEPNPGPLITPRSQMDYVGRRQTSGLDPLLWTILTVIIIAIFLTIFI